MVSPLLLIVSYSFMGSGELKEVCGAVLSGMKGMAGFRFFPAYPTLRAYVQILLDSPEFFTSFWNSCIQTGGILLGQFLVAVPAAWAFANFRFPGKNVLWFLYMLLMILPFQVTMVSGYLVLNKIHLMDTFAAIILPGMFSTLPVFILRKTFAAVPREIIETAKVDGADEFRIFLSIGLPLGKAGIFAILILGFLESWNAIEQPMTYLKTAAYWPMSLYLPQIMEKNASLAFVASMIMLVPALLLFFFGQDYLEQGIAASGLKG
ncbi:carbohydrate ABC transporter permease [Faecalicatena orotica]